MKYVVPVDIGSYLRVLPIDTYDCEVKDVFYGESKEGKPKATLKLIVLSEFSGKKDADFQSCIGETIIETMSLQPQAMFKVNDWYKGATGERIPAKPEGYEKEEFEELLKNALIGTQFSVLIETDTSQGDERTKVKKFTPIQKKVAAKSSKIKR